MAEALARETDLTSHTWSVDSLRDYALGIIEAHDKASQERHQNLKEAVDRRFHDGNRAIDIAFAGAQRGVDLALVAQKEALTVALTAAEKAVNAALAAADRAVLKAEAATERRFESVNEFRATLSDQQRNFMPRKEVDVLIEAMSEKVELNRAAIQKQGEMMSAMLALKEGRHTGLASGWGLAVGIVGFVMLLLALAARFTKP